MKRNIVLTLTFALRKVRIVVLENIATEMVELFNVCSNTKKVYNFLETSFKEIESIIGGEFSKVGIVIEPTYKTQTQIQLHHEKLPIAGHTVTKEDVNNVLQLTKQKFEGENRKVILVQPVQFGVYDIMTKLYNKAPIHKKGNHLVATSMVTSISTQVYDYIQQAIRLQGLNISQILLAPQAISQAILSKAALTNGAILIHIGEGQSFVSINQNLATTSFMPIHNFGYNNLLNGIVKTFKCSIKDATSLLVIHGSLDEPNKQRVIYIRQDGAKKIIHYAYELEKIIKLFMNKLIFVINKFLEQKKATSFSIVFAGKLQKIHGIDKYLKNIMNNELISLYNPISFVEMNEANIETLGFANFMNTIDAILGKESNTIVETNPNLVSSFANKRKINQKWYTKIINKWGGKYERN